MYTENVKDILSVEIPNNHVLVEFIEEERTVTQMQEKRVRNEEGKFETVEEEVETVEIEVVKEVVRKSNSENIKEGDIILDARYPQTNDGEIACYGCQNKKYAVLPGYEIRMWTKKENYNN